LFYFGQETIYLVVGIGKIYLKSKSIHTFKAPIVKRGGDVAII